MNVIDPFNVFEIQIDVTSYCNSFCGACVRNIKGGAVNPLVKLQHIDWDVWQQVCDFADKTKLEKISFNGNFGDISSHPKFIEMLELLYDKPNQNVRLNIHTNGGARSKDFWISLANIVKKFPGSVVTFSIDGLEDTNHIYRRGVDFSDVMKNAKAYIDAGGPARWRMIVFDHNLHQLRQASNLAKEMGFIAFSLNRSFDTSIPVVEYKGMPAGLITSPNKETVDDLRKDVEWSEDEIKNNDKKTSNSTQVSKPVCPWMKDARIQINQMGEVWPCCYFSMHTGRANDRRRFVWLDERISEYGSNFNNLNYYNIFEILNHKFYEEDLEDNFSNRLLPLCTEKCGI